MCKICEEVVTLVINDDKGGEVLNINLTHSLHTKLGEVNNLHALDRALCQYCCGTTDRAEVEASISLASVCNGLRAVTLRNHHHRATSLLEEVNI